MKERSVCFLLVTLYCSRSLAQEPLTPDRNAELTANDTAESLDTNPDSKKFFFPIIHEEPEHDDDFYPEPHFPTLFYPFLHHKPEHHPKPPHKPHKPIHKPFKPPPIVIHHKPIHKPVHIHIHKEPLHVVKPTHKPHHPEHHKPPKDDCDSNCTKDEIETINIPEEQIDESSAEDGIKYSIDQEGDESYVYSQEAEDYEKYGYNESPLSLAPKPNVNPEDSDASGIRKPITSLHDLLSDSRPVPWYSQYHEEHAPEGKPVVSVHPIVHEKPHEDHKHPCEMHIHHHYHYPHKFVEYPHPPHPSHPHKPHNPPHHLYTATKREDSTSSTTESTSPATVDHKVTIPYNEYDVSTKATTEEEKPEVESQSPKPTRKPKPKPKPNYKQFSQMLLWPFTPKPERTKASKSPTADEIERIREELDRENDDEDPTFSDFFELK